MATCVVSPTLHEFKYPSSRIMHRCAGFDAPENTLAAIKFGFNQHMNRAIEFDVQLSRDDVPIVIHDNDLSRTTSGKGIVKNHSIRSLSDLDAGSWFNESFSTEPIPLFADVMEYCKANSIWMNIELKGGDDEDGKWMYHLGATVARLTANFYHDELCKDEIDFGIIPLFSSFSVDALIAAKDFAPRIPRALLVDHHGDFPNLIETLRSIDATAVHLCDKDINEYDLVAIKNAGFKIMCYTVNSPERAAEIFALGVDAICSDRFDVVST